MLLYGTPKIRSAIASKNIIVNIFILLKGKFWTYISDEGEDNSSDQDVATVLGKRKRKQRTFL